MSIRHPIRKPSQLNKKKPLICKPMDKAWKEFLQNQWWSTNSIVQPTTEEEVAIMSRMFELRDKILAFGGKEVCMPTYEEDYDAIMQRGQFLYGDKARLKKMLPNCCHQNAARLWRANKKVLYIGTGYALSDDGMWRAHSWAVQPCSVSWRIWETTTKRLAYFGVVFNEEESEKFAQRVL